MRSRRSTKFVALPLTALVVLAACSDDAGLVTAPTAPATISVSGGGGAAPTQGRVANEMVAADTADGGAKIAPWWGATEYELAADLPALDTAADGWRFVAGDGLDTEGAARVAAAFGMQGQPEPLPAGWGGGWRLGPEDGSAPSLLLGADGLGWWSYSAPWPNFQESEMIAVDEPIEQPVEMEPPVGVPDAATAEALTRDLLVALGLEPTDGEFDVYADEWGASVSWWHLLDGRRTGFATSVGFGENAAITWAGGHLNTPERVTGFERVGTSRGFERLASGDGLWWGGVATPRADIARPYPTDAGAEGDEPPVIVVRIVDVKEAWWTLFDVDGTMWVVPGYAFIDADGGEHLVPAVADELIQPVDVPTELPSDPAVMEPAPADPGVSSPGYDPEQAAAVVERVVGATESDAVVAARELGFEARVVERDGDSFPVTADYRIDRVNLVIEGDIVTSATVG
jgi:hypothetical protein